jgi:hypothetical protein
MSGRFVTGDRAAVRWTFNRSAYAAMDRHVHALRWAGQTSGYVPPNGDPFLNHTFGPEWVQVTFDSAAAAADAPSQRAHDKPCDRT